MLVRLGIRAVCEYAYTLVQKLDPNSEGRGVLQFKTGLLSVIKVCIQAALCEELRRMEHVLISYAA